MTSTRKPLMPSSRITETTAEADAYSQGVAFDGLTSITDFEKASISRIVITTDLYIRSIAVHYANATGPTIGEVVSTQWEIIMAEGEFITSVNGSFANAAISQLGFETNKGKQWGPYGTKFPDGTEFCWGKLEPNMGLLYFSGRAESYLRSLRATFAAYPYYTPLLVLLKYEKQAENASEGPQPDALCTFARNLMSSIITLAVGPKAKELQASQGILSRLPFFRAALEGQFQEAAQKRISMPDDDLRGVLALVEYLYTGHYTYPYHCDQETDNGIPTGDTAEGFFHAIVYSTANKYGCQKLVDASLASFVHVLVQLKGIEVVRLWVVAYGEGLVLDDVAGDSNLVTFMKPLGKLLKGVYKTDREEMDRTTVENPTLIGDLLRLVVSEEESDD